MQRFAKDLLDSIDNLDRALDAVPKEKLTEENQDLVNLHGGLKMTETILSNTLKKHGMEKFDPTGEKFDPNKHEATFQVPQPDKEDGSVFHVQSKGFLYNGRVLRVSCYAACCTKSAQLTLIFPRPPRLALLRTRNLEAMMLGGICE